GCPRYRYRISGPTAAHRPARVLNVVAREAVARELESDTVVAGARSRVDSAQDPGRPAGPRPVDRAGRAYEASVLCPGRDKQRDAGVCPRTRNPHPVAGLVGLAGAPDEQGGGEGAVRRGARPDLGVRRDSPGLTGGAAPGAAGAVVAVRTPTVGAGGGRRSSRPGGRRPAG